jgi:spore coat protein SA
MQPILPERRGAIEPYIYGLAKNLAKSNDVTIFGVGAGKLATGKLSVNTTPLVRNLQLSFAKVIDPRISYYGTFTVYAIENIIRLHAKKPIDILHIHENYNGFTASVCKLLIGIPFVCSVHNEVRTVFPLKKSDKLLCVSEYLKNSLISKGMVKKEKVSIVNLAIDYPSSELLTEINAIFAKKTLGLENRKVVLFVGRICPEKGPQILVKAIDSLSKTHSNVTVIFIGPDSFFGSESSQYSQSLLADLSKKGLSKHALFKGFVSEETLRLYYLAADVVVCPSIWNEPFGKVIIEALGYAKPVVASNVGGIPEIIKNEFNGLLVSPGNVFELSQAISKLLDDSLLGKNLGETGRLFAIKKYNFETAGKSCIEAYREVIGK